MFLHLLEDFDFLFLPPYFPLPRDPILSFSILPTFIITPSLSF